VSNVIPGEESSSRPELLRVLLVEDLEDDAQLILRELKREGLSVESRRVASEAALRDAMNTFAPDIVLADHALPGFGAQVALRLVRTQWPGVPVIVVTGSVDEETAAEYIMAGAVDYIVKQRLFRLGGAVRRALALRQAQRDARAATAALRELEEQHRQAQKMEAIGRLASGVAHDFNNLLTVIGSCCEMVLEDVPVDSRIRPDLLEIREAVARATKLTRQLLAFSRRQAVTPQRVDLNAVIDTMAGMLRRLLGGSVTVSFTASPGLGLVWADPGRVEQVVMNLAVNARDAMPRGGQLTLAAQDVEVERTHAGAAGVQPGPYVMLAVTDTGTGMDAATRAHLFEPFFTTKPKDKGTGLGLATVYGIVHQAGGFIQVESEVGKGSTFRVYWPRVSIAPLGA
jgi:two-component system, cell cycle sensor histidine kinase and response regulator CckA